MSTSPGGILERIKDIEFEMKRTQKNKATNAHLCLLRAKLAKLRTMLIDGPKAGLADHHEGFDVMKSGDARVAMIGFPSVGKSSTLSKLTETKSEAASFEFTTLTCIPGILNYNDANIQLLDLPGIIEGASKGKGRGKQVISVARTSDMILMMLDAEKADIHRRLLTIELENVGIRLNKKPPDVNFVRKKAGGIMFNSIVKQNELTEEVARKLLRFYKIHHCHILLRDQLSTDDFIDLIEGNRVYLPCLYVVNKVDMISLNEVDRHAHQPHTCVVSIREEWNIDFMLERLWDHLNIIRIFTKPRGQRPSFKEPLILRKGATIEHVCHRIHRDFAKKLKYALVWGTSAKHEPQRVGLNHPVEEEDVVQLMAN
jgi:small GTP-binding protein